MKFRDDESESNPASFKFLEAARAWKSVKSKKPTETLPPKPQPAAAVEEDASSDVASSHGGADD